MSDSNKCNTCGRKLKTDDQLEDRFIDWCRRPGDDICRLFTTINSLAAALESILGIYSPNEPLPHLAQMKLRTARAVLETYPQYIKLHTPQGTGHHGSHASSTVDGDAKEENEQSSPAGGSVDSTGPATGDLPP